MKTTIEISDELLRRAKQAALERGTTLRVIVEEALSRALGAGRSNVAPMRTVTWPPTGGTHTTQLDTKTVLEAIARERDRELAPDDSGHGDGHPVPAPRQHKKKKKK